MGNLYSTSQDILASIIIIVIEDKTIIHKWKIINIPRPKEISTIKYLIFQIIKSQMISITIWY